MADESRRVLTGGDLAPGVRAVNALLCAGALGACLLVASSFTWTAGLTLAVPLLSASILLAGGSWHQPRVVRFAPEAVEVRNRFGVTLVRHVFATRADQHDPADALQVAERFRARVWLKKGARPPARWAYLLKPATLRSLLNALGRVEVKEPASATRSVSLPLLPPTPSANETMRSVFGTFAGMAALMVCAFELPVLAIQARLKEHVE